MQDPEHVLYDCSYSRRALADQHLQSLIAVPSCPSLVWWLLQPFVSRKRGDTETLLPSSGVCRTPELSLGAALGCRPVLQRDGPHRFEDQGTPVPFPWAAGLTTGFPEGPKSPVSSSHREALLWEVAFALFI